MTMKNAKIYYFCLPDEMRKEEKLEWLCSHSIDQIEFESVHPDKNSNWINLADTDFDRLLPLISDDRRHCVFSMYAMGVVTARDEWVYDLNKNNLLKKMSFFIEHYNHLLKKNAKETDKVIKWSDTLKRNFISGKKIIFDKNSVVKAYYRPYHCRFFYAEKMLNDRLTGNHAEIFGKNYNEKNKCFGMIGKDTAIPFSVLAFNTVSDLNSLSNAAGGNKTFPLCVFSSAGERTDNITVWALEQFRKQYQLSGFSGLTGEQDENRGGKKKMLM